MKNENYDLYGWDEMPKYIEWEKSSKRSVYYIPLLLKHENPGHTDAYIAMYAQQYYRNGIYRYKETDYLFRVMGPSLVETLQRFRERFLKFQEDGFIFNRKLKIENIKSDYETLIHQDLFWSIRNLNRQNYMRSQRLGITPAWTPYSNNI